MTTAMQRSNGAGALALWSDAHADLQLVRDLYAKNATDAEFRLFIYQANTYQLDPMLRQIWCVKNPKRLDLPASIFAGLAGLLHIAHRSGQFDGIESEGVYNDTGELISAWAVVYRKDAAHPFRVSVLLREYRPTYNGSLWDSKPETMLKKVAKCQALREAFDVSGLYDPAEMERDTVLDGTFREVPETSAQAQNPIPAESGVPSIGAQAPKAAAGTTEAPRGNQGQPLTADDYRKRIKELIAPLGKPAQQTALLDHLIYGPTTALAMDDPDATVDDALGRLNMAELRQLGMQIKGLHLATPDDLNAWFDRQVADSMPVAS